MLKYFLPFLFCVTCSAQFSHPQPYNAAQSDPMEAQRIAFQQELLNSSAPASIQERLSRGQMAQLVAERQAQLRRDTEKLVALTAELKEHVEKSGPHILSMEVVKKAAEIQKLAKSVEEKMKNAY